MRSGLLSSLFRDNSASSRSSSLFQKNQLSLQTQTRTRSQSNHRNRIHDYTGQNKYVPLHRMNLLVNGKIRVYKQTAFCRIQNHGRNMIKQKTASAVKISANKQRFLSLMNQHKQQNKQQHSKQYLCQQFTFDSSQQPSKSLQKNHKLPNTENSIISQQSINNLGEIYKVLQAKYYHNKLLGIGFKQIQRYNLRKQGCNKFKNILQKLVGKGDKERAIQNIKQTQKNMLKYDILISSINQIIKPVYHQFITYMKSIKSKIIQNQEQLYFVELEDKAKLVKSFKLQSKQDLKQKQLCSITQQQCSLSQEQAMRIAMYHTPRKQQQVLFQAHNKQYKQYNKQYKKRSSKQNPLRESSKMIDFSSDQFDNEQQQRYPPKFLKKIQSNSNKKITTAINSCKIKIDNQKSVKIDTKLSENDIINIYAHSPQEQLMNKMSKIRSETINQQVPDLHDNFGVFDQLQISRRVDSFPTSYRSSSQNPDFSRQFQMSCHKTLQPMRITQLDQQYYHTQQINQKQRNQINSRSPNFSSKKKPSTKLNPLHNIQQMMLQLQRLQQRQKHLKYSSNNRIGYPKCKISVNLPYRKCSNKSTNNSASKNSVQNVQTFSQKKNKRRDLLARYHSKAGHQHKQNIEVKLWDDKVTKFYCPNQNKNSNNQIKKKNSSGCISTAEISMLSTARKMKKQIQCIINSRKNRSSIGGLKINGTKF